MKLAGGGAVESPPAPLHLAPAVSDGCSANQPTLHRRDRVVLQVLFHRLAIPGDLGIDGHVVGHRIRRPPRNRIFIADGTKLNVHYAPQKFTALKTFLMVSGSPSSHSSGFVPVVLASFLAVCQDGRRVPLRIRLIRASDFPTLFANLDWIPFFMVPLLLLSSPRVKKNLLLFLTGKDYLLDIPLLSVKVRLWERIRKRWNGFIRKDAGKERKKRKAGA